MQRAFEKIIDELKAESIIVDDEAGNRAVEIINQVASEYGGVTTCYLGIPCEYQNEDINVGKAEKELLEKLIEAKRNCGEDSDCSACIFGQVEDRCYLAELQIGNGGGWIPVEERLPETDDEVLCWYEYRTLSGTHEGELVQTFDKGWYSKYFEKWCGEVSHGNDARVIAWKPIEPYKAESEE